MYQSATRNLTEEPALSQIIRSGIAARRADMLALLQSSLRCQSVSGNEARFVHMLADWALSQGFAVDQWVGDEPALQKRFGKLSRHLPLANRPTLVVTLRGSAERRSLLFNGHTDVVGAGDGGSWRHDPWAGISPNHSRNVPVAEFREEYLAAIEKDVTREDSIVYGRGACDVKGPIVSALWAMLALQRVPAEQRGDVAVELVPGEEDCVGLGTLTSVARGHGADASIVLEPTQGVPCCASRGGCRFEIVASGRAVHGTVKWLGVDAIGIMQKVMAGLKNIEARWNDRGTDALFSGYPIARPITVDRIDGGGWQGMICERCVCSGYMELLPGDDLGRMKKRLERELREEIGRAGEDPERVGMAFVEEYRGHFTSPDDPFCGAAKASFEIAGDSGKWPGWRGFNSGCEAGVRPHFLGTPTIVWGPGSLEHAHAADERIDFRDVESMAQRFTHCALGWAQKKEEQICYRPRARPKTAR